MLVNFGNPSPPWLPPLFGSQGEELIAGMDVDAGIGQPQEQHGLQRQQNRPLHVPVFPSHIKISKIVFPAFIQQEMISDELMLIPDPFVNNPADHIPKQRGPLTKRQIARANTMDDRYGHLHRYLKFFPSCTPLKRGSRRPEDIIPKYIISQMTAPLNNWRMAKKEAKEIKIASSENLNNGDQAFKLKTVENKQRLAVINFLKVLEIDQRYTKIVLDLASKDLCMDIGELCLEIDRFKKINPLDPNTPKYLREIKAIANQALKDLGAVP